MKKGLLSILSILAVLLFAQPAFAQKVTLSQDGSYCGRSNPNEPLLKMRFTFNGSYPSFDITPWFDSMGGVKELKNLKVWIRLYPESPNPLLADQRSGISSCDGTVSNKLDITTWDYRHPETAPNQTVWFLGTVALELESGKAYSVDISKMVTDAVKIPNAAMYYVFVTADIDAEALEFTTDSGKFTPNLIGGVASNLKIGNTIVTLPSQQQKTRRILKERKIINVPFDGYSRYYRIPAICNTSDGALVITSDARKYRNTDIPNNLDVLSRISFDNGQTWSDHIIIAQGTGSTSPTSQTNSTGYGDAAIGQLPIPGTMMCCYISGKGLREPDQGPNVWFSESINGGQSWSQPAKIDANVFHITGSNRNNAVVCPSPGRMLLVESGPLKGKLLGAFYVWESSSYTTVDIMAYDQTTRTWTCLGWIDGALGESHLVQLSDTEFLLSSRDQSSSGGASARKWNRLTYNANAGATASKFTFTAISEDSKNRLTGTASGCNTGLFIYEGAADGKKYLIETMPASSGNPTSGGSATVRKDVWMKYADLTDIISKKTGAKLSWKEGMNMTLNQGAGGYSSITQQPDGSIGYVGEEYMLSFANNHDDALLSIWYMSTTFENLTQGNVTRVVTPRFLPRPTIDPSHTTFTINSEGKFETSENAELPVVTISVDESKIELADNETWALQYQIVAYNKDNTVKKTYDVTRGANATNNITFDISELDCTFVAGDYISVVAYTVAIDKSNDVVERSAQAAAKYLVVNPARRIILHIMPESAGDQAFIYFEGMVTANEHEVLVQQGGRIDLKVTLGGYSEFVGFSLNDTKYEKDALTTANSLFKPQIFDNPLQLGLTVPSISEYEGDKLNYNCIHLYAWVKKKGGLYSHALVSWNGEPDNYTPTANWCSSGSIAKPDILTVMMDYPTLSVNDAQGEMTFYKNVEKDPTFLYLTLAPDRYTYTKSLIVALYRRTETGLYEPLTDAAGNIIYRTVAGHEDADKQIKADAVWVGETHLPAEVTMRIPTGMAYQKYNKDEKTTNIGFMVLYVVETLPSDEEIKSFITEQASDLYAKQRAARPYLYNVIYPLHIKDTIVSVDSLSAAMTIEGGQGMVTITVPQPTTVRIVNAQGIVMGNYQIDSRSEIQLPAGVYMADGRKFIVR